MKYTFAHEPHTEISTHYTLCALKHAIFDGIRHTDCWDVARRKYFSQSTKTFLSINRHEKLVD